MLLEPVDVVEPAIDVTTLRGGFTFVAEYGPHVGVVVDAGDKISPHGLEESGAFYTAKDVRAVDFAA